MSQQKFMQRNEQAEESLLPILWYAYPLSSYNRRIGQPLIHETRIELSFDTAFTYSSSRFKVCLPPSIAFTFLFNSAMIALDLKIDCMANEVFPSSSSNEMETEKL